MLLRLLLLFTIVPICELIILLWLGHALGALPTLLIILTTGAIGAFLARRQGAVAWTRVRETLARGELPAGEMLDAVMILVAGALLITPGVLTDITGFLLLLPAGRAALRRRLVAYFKRRITFVGGMDFETGAAGGPDRPPRPAADEVIDLPPEPDAGADEPQKPSARLHS